MLGYVTAERAELRMREYDIYKGYYCGICKSIARRIGQAPRLVLSYDSVFLAMLLGALEEGDDRLAWEHCVVHPIKKVPVCREGSTGQSTQHIEEAADAQDALGSRKTAAAGSGFPSAIDYAADVMVLLAYYNVLDDWQDDRSVKAFMGKTALHPAVKRLLRERPEYEELCEEIVNALKELSTLEKEKCESIDKIGERFAIIMESIFTFYFTVYGKTLPNDDSFAAGYGKTLPKNEGAQSANRNLAIAPLREIGRHLGKWIYLIDAVDDLAEDIKKGSYNPLIYRFGYGNGSSGNIYGNANDKGSEGDCYEKSLPNMENSQQSNNASLNIESPAAFWERIKEQVEYNLFQYLGQIANAYDLLDIRKNKDIIENIIFFGLRNRTEAILKKGVDQTKAKRESAQQNEPQGKEKS